MKPSGEVGEKGIIENRIYQILFVTNEKKKCLKKKRCDAERT